jgi:hypothetical protein
MRHPIVSPPTRGAWAMRPEVIWKFPMQFKRMAWSPPKVCMNFEEDCLPRFLISNTDDHLCNHGFLYEGHRG